MILSRLKTIFIVSTIMIFSAVCFAQNPKPTPPEENPVTVNTQEIKVNIAAFDDDGNFAQALKKEDVVINEDGRLHQANIIQHIPANVLILLDTGGENRQAKDFKTTRNAAKGLVNALQKDDKIAVMQYFDKAELISDWTDDKAQINNVLDKKMNFGMRSRFADALNQAADFLAKSNVENRHLVLISDGLDSTTDEKTKTAAIQNLTAMNVNVHIFSYTQMELQAAAKNEKTVKSGGKISNNLPPGAGDPNMERVMPQTQKFPIATINLDRAMIRKQHERAAALVKSEKDLSQLAQDTNGIFYLPGTTEEFIDKTASLAKNIDSQYVITYTPKRPLDESPDGEVRTIEVTSRRDGVYIQARRKLRVNREK